MTAKDYRTIAKEKLGKDTGTYALIALIEAFLSFALSYTVVGSIVISGPLALGVAGCYLAGVRDEKVSIENMFKGFDNFLSAFVLELVNSIFIFLWSLLLIVPGIVASLSYSMSVFVLKDNPTITASEARHKSIELMKGNRWKLFCLEFSFIGWILLSLLTFGILFIWVLPYMGLAKAEFYKTLTGEPVVVIEENASDDSDDNTNCDNEQIVE